MMQKKRIFRSLFILLAGTAFLSCNSDDMPVKEKNDPIVGDWERQKEVFIFENDSVAINDFSQCPKINSLIFMNAEYDKAIALYFYTPINENSPDSCKVVSGGGTWTKISDKKYSMHIEYYENYYPYTIIGEETTLFRTSFPAPDSLHLHNLNKLEQYQLEMEGLQDFYTIYTLDDGGIDHSLPLP